MLVRLSDLRNARVRSLDGDTLGRVHEVHSHHGRIVAVTCGPGSFIERLTGRKHGRLVPWKCVVRIGGGEIFVSPDPPQRSPRKSSASRTRRGTRPSSGRPSKR